MRDSARLARGVRLRRETFGAIAYVSERDHFYALDHAHVEALSAGGTPELAAAGICASDLPQRAFYGRSQFGSFPGGLPAVSLPLVVNCFATAHCPLRCTYCHADDLMAGYRDRDEEAWLGEVIRVARATPAMVGVVTGGEPLSRPGRAGRLIRALARDKAVVLDTSGAGDLGRLVPVLRECGVHVRISLDSADRAVNDRLRPINRRYLPLGASSHRSAWDAIGLARAEGLSCSVQTVVTGYNGTLPQLLALRDELVAAGVRTWTLHVVVPAGKAANRPPGLLAGDDAVTTLVDVVDDTATHGLPLDIRVTSTHRAPNSTLLISARGEVAVERGDGTGKDVMRVGRFAARTRMVRHFRRRVDPAGHAGRYLNGTLDLSSYRLRTGADQGKAWVHPATGVNGGLDRPSPGA
ncbi:radical SAM protein [Actinoplanes sp. NPDC049265]|uniref:radical SAM protein n=1 Tax=Actinoplanes sp. NPDC049265 TaxID=3363902 RepID=UPI00371F1829